MIVCINCSAETKAKLDALLSKDGYGGYSELVEAAVDNLWMLEKEVAKHGALVIGESLSKPVHLAPPTTAEKVQPKSYTQTVSAQVPKANTPKIGKKAIESVPVCIPDLFLADGLDDLSAATAEIPATGEPDEAFTLDRWLFGQYNKLLPIKANCRALLRIAAEHPEGVPLENLAPRIGEAAALLGDYLADHDRRHQIARDDLLATAFPRSGPEAEKSRARYANQFVGSVNSQGVLSGMLWDYRMALLGSGMAVPALNQGQDACATYAQLLLTEPALQFARLANPVLDGCQVNPIQKFSSEEAEFLLGHIRAHVPVEAFAFQTLIQAIADGADTPDTLDESLHVHVPTETNRSLSPSFLTSQRSGALSRMADLGLIARERKGVRVSYTITPEGEAFVSSDMLRDARKKGCS